MADHQKLDFVVIGSQKCASTWIYDCLKNHPHLNLRNSKNEDAYYGGAMYRQNGGDAWYFSQFKRNLKPKGCVSVEYIEDAATPTLLHELNPEIKIIASLRQPAQRAISAYKWFVRRAYIPDLPLEEGLGVLLKHYHGELQTEYSLAYKNIIDRGFYAKRLKNWYKTFPSNQIRISFFDEVKQNAAKTINDLMLFLETNASYVPPNLNTIPKKNSGFAPLIKLERKFPNSRVVVKLADLTNQLLYKKQIKNVNDDISENTLNELNKIYSSSIKELDDLFSVYDSSSQKKLQTFWNRQLIAETEKKF